VISLDPAGTYRPSGLWLQGAGPFARIGPDAQVASGPVAWLGLDCAVQCQIFRWGCGSVASGAGAGQQNLVDHMDHTVVGHDVCDDDIGHIARAVGDGYTVSARRDAQAL
jgi:hypothetical protein